MSYSKFDLHVDTRKDKKVQQNLDDTRLTVLLFFICVTMAVDAMVTAL